MGRWVAIIGLAFGVAGFGGVAQALMVTLEDCGTCNGADISLEVTTGGSGYLATYSIDFSDFDRVAAGPAPPNGLDHMTLISIGFKAFDKGLVDGDVSFVSTPGDVWGDPFIGNINNAGCLDGTSAELICANGALAIPDADADTQVFSWVFDVAGDATVKDDEWSIRGAFGPHNGWVISESGAPIPEPTGALLFAGGALLVGYRSRRRIA